jgi:hypothetical protein
MMPPAFGEGHGTPIPHQRRGYRPLFGLIGLLIAAPQQGAALWAGQLCTIYVPFGPPVCKIRPYGIFFDHGSE